MKHTSLTGNLDFALLNLTASITRLQQGYRTAVDVIVKNAGVTQSLAWPLMMIAWHDRHLPTSVLADTLEIKNSTLSRLLTQLEDAGFVAYRKDGQNRVTETIELTSAGVATCTKIENEMRNLHNTLYKDLPDRLIDTCLHMISILEHRIESSIRTILLRSNSESHKEFSE